MSRIGKNPVPIPGGVTLAFEGTKLVVKGPKGELSEDLNPVINVAIGESEVVVTRPDDQRQSRELHGLYRSLIQNMIIGVTEGFKRELDIVGVGYRCQAVGNGLKLQLGFSHDVDVEGIEGIEFEVPSPTKIIIKGINKQKVGQVAANIRAIRPPEPYKGKGVKYSDEVISRKAGKAAG